MKKTIIVCTTDDMHPYECSHDNRCPHCTNAKLKGHDPERCWLCCDGDPKKNKPERLVDKPYKYRKREEEEI